MAKCKWHRDTGLTMCDWQGCKNANPYKDKCPKNTNDKCNIIPKKKDKMVRVKARAVIVGSEVTASNAKIYIIEHLTVPCTILISSMHISLCRPKQQRRK